MEEAARRYQLATQASSQIDGFLSQRTQISRVNHRANDINNKNRNLFDGSDAGSLDEDDGAGSKPEPEPEPEPAPVAPKRRVVRKKAQ